MPSSITKNRISFQEIQKMVQKAFNQNPLHIMELTEGYFNVAYQIKLQNKTVILKIAPSPTTPIMTHEKNIMFSEVDSMQMIAEKTSIPVPKILFYDNSHTLCTSDYFFMEMLDGESFSNCMEQISEKTKKEIFFTIGNYTRIMNCIKNDKFGYYGQPEKQGSLWYPVFKRMIEDTYFDAERKNIQIPVMKQQLLERLEADREIFEHVTEAKFVHWDIWAGNVFIKGNKITGLIDFERCLWADELMEVGFRTYNYEESFYHGYGITSLNSEQKQRAKWYDIYLFLILCLESDYRMYDNRDTYHWGCEMLKKWVTAMK